MAITVCCPQCAKRLYVPAKKLGDEVKCPNCNSSLSIGVREEVAEVPDEVPFGPNPSPLGFEPCGLPQSQGKSTATVSAWTIFPETVADAEGMMRQSAISFYVVAGLLAVTSVLLGIATLLDALLLAGLAFWLHRTYSRVAATLLLLLAGVSVVMTMMNKLGGGEGGRNVLLSAFLLWAGVRAAVAAYRLPKLRSTPAALPSTAVQPPPQRDVLMFHTDCPQFDEDGTLRIRFALDSGDGHIDGMQTIKASDSEYAFWCWLIAQPRYKGIIDGGQYRNAQRDFERIRGIVHRKNGDPVSTAEISEREAEEIVDSFAEVLETATECVLDAQRLHHPKSTIRVAFGIRIQCLERRCKEDPYNPESADHLQMLRALRLRVSDFQIIDSDDQRAVQEAIAGRLDDRKTVLLTLKYHQRAMKEDGLPVENALERGKECLSFGELCKRFSL